MHIEDTCLAQVLLHVTRVDGKIAAVDREFVSLGNAFALKVGSVYVVVSDRFDVPIWSRELGMLDDTFAAEYFPNG